MQGLGGEYGMVGVGADVLSGRVVLGDNGGRQMIALYQAFVALMFLMCVWTVIIFGAIWIAELTEKILPEAKVIAFWRRVWGRVSK